MTDLAQEIAVRLPYLRRYARALTGSQTRGDEYIRVCLEVLVEEPSRIADGEDLRVQLYRLFHEEGVRVFPARPLTEFCRCSRERVLTFLKSFGAKELEDMREPDGAVGVTCEFCSTRYNFTPDEIE